ncbi:MAG: PHB depolymerase family esterase [Pirellulales bacterium]
MLREVTEMLDAYTATDQQIADTRTLLDARLVALRDDELRDQFAPLVDEIKSGLTANTTDRLAAFRRLADDVDLGPESQLSLAVSGWILGVDGSTDDLRTVLSAVKLRGLVADYLREKDPLRRDTLLTTIRSEEGMSPEAIARLLAELPPPLPLPEQAKGYQGGYVLSVPTVANEAPVEYLLQLPPEYDPNRRYPTIVTLHGEMNGAAQQIDWWCGEVDENSQRHGQAGRHGYVVIAPSWTKPAQTTYGFTSLEHAAVLNVLRDAMRRVSIDTDRVYLSGHSIGGDAAWDLAMAHPDLWAGVIPIVAVADKYCDHYWKNLREQPPVYAVTGELDGDKTSRNSMTYDRLLMTSHYNVTVVEFIGRGHESFSDDIQRIFEWMGLQRRNFFPLEFTCTAMRPWDNFFWWVEVDEFPETSVVFPEQWPPKRPRPVLVEAKRSTNNTIRVKSGTDAIRLYLTPEMVDFSRPVQVTVTGGRSPRRGTEVVPDVGVMLEDARTRSDRQHPYWAVLDFDKGRMARRP